MSTPSIEFVVISLPGSERRRGVADRFSQLPWSWRFFDAHTPANNPLPFDPERAFVRRGYRLSAAEIGCFSSHLSCLAEHAASAGAVPYRIVLEDDVALDSGFDFNSLPTLMESLEIHYLRLFSRFITRVRYLGRIGSARGLYRFVVPPYGSQAYIVSKAGARQFVESIQRVDRPVDDELDRYWRHGLPPYALFPYPVSELSLGTSVQKGYSNDRPASAAQKLQSVAFHWGDKFLRESANARLLARDRQLRRRVSQLRSLFI